ncbi:hypothetical protein [Ferruginibacter profundus]
MRTFIILLALGILNSCGSKYPSEKYVLAKKYRDLLSSYNEGDTIKYVDGKGNFCLYLITKIDSSFIDQGVGMISTRGRKDISISCRELTNPKKGYEDYWMFILTKYPDDDSTYFDFRIKDFYGPEPHQLIEPNSDTLIANGIIISNYYSFIPYNLLEQRDSNSVVKLYMTNKNGIIAYRCKNGIWWTRLH